MDGEHERHVARTRQRGGGGGPHDVGAPRQAIEPRAAGERRRPVQQAAGQAAAQGRRTRGHRGPLPAREDGAPLVAGEGGGQSAEQRARIVRHPAALPSHQASTIDCDPHARCPADG